MPGLRMIKAHDAGHSVELLNLSDDGEIDILRFDAVDSSGLQSISPTLSKVP